VTTLYLVRHAESAPDRRLPEDAWPLSARGHAQAHALVERFAGAGIAAFVSSPYRRAVDTLAPLAAANDRAIALEPDLRERRLTGGFADDWETLLRQSWRDFALAHPGGESGLACQQRVACALHAIATRHRDATVGVCSHGNAIALFLNLLDRRIGEADWRAMRTPHVFLIAHGDAGFRWIRDFDGTLDD
jgi:2,3-bisphosphoglycerate-dependent phosphoglycerate mutase